MQKSVFIYKVFLTKLQATTSCFKKKKCFCSCSIFLNKWHIPTIQYKTDLQQRYVAFKLMTATGITKQRHD